MNNIVSEQRYFIRDRETEKVLKTFRSKTTAKSYFVNMDFGLKEYYEIYDSDMEQVVFSTDDYIPRMGRNVQKQ